MYMGLALRVYVFPPSYYQVAFSFTSSHKFDSAWFVCKPAAVDEAKSADDRGKAHRRACRRLGRHELWGPPSRATDMSLDAGEVIIIDD